MISTSLNSSTPSLLLDARSSTLLLIRVCSSAPRRASRQRAPLAGVASRLHEESRNIVAKHPEDDLEILQRDLLALAASDKEAIHPAKRALRERDADTA